MKTHIGVDAESGLRISRNKNVVFSEIFHCQFLYSHIVSACYLMMGYVLLNSTESGYLCPEQDLLHVNKTDASG